MTEKKNPEKETPISGGEKIRKIIGVGGVLTPANLLSITQELRTLTINNSHRIPGFRPIADKLGSIETLIIDTVGKDHDKNMRQEKLPLDKPEKVDKELAEASRRPKKGKQGKK